MYFNKEQFKRAETIIVASIDLANHINTVIVPANKHKYKEWNNTDISAGAIICPFHDDKDPSFSYDKKRNFAYCFGCHKGGNIIGVHKAYMNSKAGTKNATYRDALNDLAKIYHIDIPQFEFEDAEASKSVKEEIKTKLEEYRENRLKRREKIKNGVTGVTNKQLKEFNELLINAGVESQCLFDIILVSGKNAEVKYEDLFVLFKKYLNTGDKQ